MLASPEGASLPLAKRRLADSVSAMIDPKPLSINGIYRWADPVYNAMRAELRSSYRYRTALFGSRAPCRLDALEWLRQVDRAVYSWEPKGEGTVARLRELAARGWRVQDCAVIAVYTDRLAGWLLVAAELLADTPKCFLERPCPNCGSKFAYHNDSGERVRRRALRVSEEGCWCGGVWGILGPGSVPFSGPAAGLSGAADVTACGGGAS